jgi:hypothetical protein
VSIISKAELERIKAITKIQTKEEQEMQQTVIQEQRATSLMASKARRQRIIENDFKRASQMQNTKVVATNIPKG